MHLVQNSSKNSIHTLNVPLRAGIEHFFPVFVHNGTAFWTDHGLAHYSSLFQRDVFAAMA
jgi:hypothetical protein